LSLIWDYRKTSAAAMITSLSEMLPGTPVLAMTGYPDPMLHASIVEAGARRVIQKPFSADDLVGEVHALLT
jgi:DNA-binding response OmpR family regulator